MSLTWERIRYFIAGALMTGALWAFVHACSK